MSSSLFPNLLSVCDQLASEVDLIPQDRKSLLLKLTKYLHQSYSKSHIPKLTSICTHNSRRSHILQLWVAIAADYYNLPKIDTYSGGTEATAFNPSAVQALERIGLEISAPDNTLNPIYNVRWNAEMPPYQAFSKHYADPPNPSSGFAAILVCTQADESCPTVFGSAFRLALPYDDPKAFDGTPQAPLKYDERVLQIGREILFSLSQIQLP